MRFGSVCSGIEAASVASASLGWEAAWFSEIEPFPCAVLDYHYTGVPNHGDMTLLPKRIADGVVEAPELFVGGTPCQAFSVAGHRKGLDDARGNLTLVFCDIADAIDEARARRGEQPSILFWENVPGVLSDKSNAFGCFLGELAGEDCELQPPGKKWENAGVVVGPKRTIAWRILDAQYFGVAQRRRRVFVVASARTDFDPVSVLFEFDGVRRDSAPSRESRKETAADVGAGFTATGGWGAPDGGNTVGTLMARDYKGIGNQDLEDGRGECPVGGPTYAKESDVCDTVCSKWVKGYGGPAGSETGNMVMQPIAIQGNLIGRSENAGPQGVGASEDGVMYTLTKADVHGCAAQMQVRRLTPIECERLQGFPDDYTNIPWRKSPTSPDGPRYKALGNSWAVPCVAWIFRRIADATA